MNEHPISDESLIIWKFLPPEVRNDPCLSQFRLEYIRVYGHENKEFLLTTDNRVQNTQSESVPMRTPLFVIIFLIAVWLVATAFLITIEEKVIKHQLIVVENKKSNVFNISEITKGQRFGLTLEGPFKSHARNDTEFLIVIIGNSSQDEWKIPLEKDRLQSSIHTHICQVNSENVEITITTNSTTSIAIQMGYDPSPVDAKKGAFYAGCILLFLNALIISEVIHRSFAALLAAFFSIGMLAALGDRPTMVDIIGWLDFETLLLIFSMMTLVNILMDTGIFDYVAVCIFKLSKGKSWPLVTTICIFTVVISSFLDNVTTILLMTPIVVRLCECLRLNPVPILPILILHANIAGLSTLVGHPPNLIITANPYVVKHGVTFLTYSMHMVIGVVIALIQSHIQIRLQYGDIATKLTRAHPSAEAQSLLSSKLSLWERSCATFLSSNSRDHQLLQNLMEMKLKELKGDVLKESEQSDGLISACVAPEIFHETLERLQREYPIKNRPLLVKSSMVFALVISMFFIESVPQIQRLSLGWCSLTGVILMLLISNQNLDALMQRIEWTTLLFFASMFITMECAARLGLIAWIGQQTESLILCVDDQNAQLAVAIIIVLWISAFTSSVVDSVPVTAMMIKIVVALAQNEHLALPIQPLVWALAFGPTMGGNGTLYGASANIVCAGVAEKLGHKITFFQYFRVAFPVMIGNVLLTTAYLLIAHILLQWH